MSASLAHLGARIRRRMHRVTTLLVPPPPLADALGSLPESFRNRLLSMYAGQPQLGAESQTYSLDYISRISPEEGMWLYRLCREVKPQNTLEIGLGYGFSTIYFLAGLYANGMGHHTAMDPFQLRETSKWRGIGLQHARLLNVESLFTFFEETSLHVLEDFAKRGRQFELIFIDGGHLFDEVLMDFTLSAMLSPEGGYIVLDDTWMPSVRRALAFIRKNRTDFVAVASPVENIMVLRRTGPDAREWNHYVEFAHG